EDQSPAEVRGDGHTGPSHGLSGGVRPAWGGAAPRWCDPAHTVGESKDSSQESNEILEYGDSKTPTSPPRRDQTVIAGRPTSACRPGPAGDRVSAEPGRLSRGRPARARTAARPGRPYCPRSAGRAARPPSGPSP